MKYVRPLIKRDFVETMASWPIVRWTVPRLGVAYAWALLPFLYTRSKNRSDSLHEVPSLPFQDL